MKQTIQRVFVLLLSLVASRVFAQAATKPVRGFVLAGQSNMLGHGFVAVVEL